LPTRFVLCKKTQHIALGFFILTATVISFNPLKEDWVMEVPDSMRQWTVIV
jgi:hypothetical protein